MVKLLMGWNIIPKQEGDYFEFVVREFEPGLLELGLHVTDVWLTVYGEWPQIITGAVSQDLATVHEVLASDKWRSLKGRLLQYVTDYQQKIIRANGNYQL